ncbi:FYVE, RhoGEF and PH domain-containing protein 2 isoform X1 [Mustela nigripes]|uniref:FYVE, RhoGEF and PH domain containing 2 n=3 Tax=Mustela putorius furo TaxID=9669 RepID=M3YRR4_MUSPF|nr:FYVE, RhoGEF and PH domain-containing protein 2 isoform X1 [Mustela putorius furo]XP_044927053.1 FYVE, RhoGEF and PH domain-containing protein 2 isoform X1 [Mustela putorius furo]XP_044927055.1 FYVE, RhoGEF and PH domain-containing protein 2 isoform X1 [Mustela putorius furo]XP_044927056.1 FYVE, RhoGEF and PH domain-containing protein 2 isoform X1 [Mustela putorius furo]XP_059033786.1 FYVE, RhoGEF and PH domain-containing protein 2 isoform X1 [Mustela lutreola]XP_059033787.1 FYVE, RhoGEF an
MEACRMEGESKEKLASVSSLVTVFENSRTPGAASRVCKLEIEHHCPGGRAPPPAEPWKEPNLGETLQGSEPRMVSRRYLSSLKNKLSSGAWRKSCQPGTDPGLGTQEPEEKRIVQELLETEKAYVARLHLLDQVFFQELLREARASKAFPEDVVRLIFSNISSIYQFHAQFFLPELQRRLDDWTATPRIGDVIQKLAPFLKMYSEYVKNFERAAELLASWTDKSAPFQEVITRIQSSEASGSLTLQHHMLEPVQRIPRYELLLKEYVQKLPAQAPDRADAQKALDMIFLAAQHSNAAITEMERLQDLWDVYQRLGLEDDIVDPSNTLLREGPVLKISFRRSDPMERYLFLFNNMLLYCIPKVIQVGAQFQVRTRIDVAGMKVRELTDAEFPHSFLVSGKQRTLELQARSQEEMISWIQACQAAIDQIEKRNETFKAAVQGPEGDTQEQEQLQSEELGLRAPQWVRDKMVTMCMRCREPFNALMRRRHHCRACGYVVCAKCSDYRAELKYDGNRPNRVCFHCYTFLTGNVLREDKEDKKRGILEKGSTTGSEQSIMCGFLQLVGDKWGKSGPRGWCVIPRDDPLVLYVYAAPQDMRAHTSVPLLGYQVTAGTQADSRVFQLQQSGQLYTFKAETEELRDRWVKAMERAASGWSPRGPSDGDLSD